ncbi:ice-binding family protein [uncultured Jatrophihabitans sp.]|uniref:ice-binding family protein n=1 Tax=uncultured Jatrophihabitans sp. TaxID=1610747 RepID=UPI0035CA494B
MSTIPVSAAAASRFPRHRSIMAAAMLTSLVAIGVSWAQPASAATGTVNLATSAEYSVLAGQGVTNTGASTLNADLGSSPAPASYVTGFPPGIVGGSQHFADGPALQAQSDLTTAYNDAAGRPVTANVPGDIANRTVVAGVYKASTSLGLSGALTLNGQHDPSSVFIFQVPTALTTASASSVNLINGAQACHVFWQIGSSATLGTSSVFRGTIMALQSISMNNGVQVQGRALARNGSVTLINDTFTSARCAATPPATSTTTTTSLPSGPVHVGGTIPVRVRVSGTGGTVPTGRVTVLDNGKVVGSGTLDSTGRVTVKIPTGSTPGTRTITARYGGSPVALTSTSTGRTVTVRAAPSTPTSSTASGTPSTSTPTSTSNLTHTTVLASTGVHGLPPLIVVAVALLALGLVFVWAARRPARGRHRDQ